MQNNEDWKDRRKRIKYEAYLDWIDSKTKGMSESSVIRVLNQGNANPSVEELEPHLFKLYFARIFHQNHNYQSFIKCLNDANLSKLWRIDLGEFSLENPYERFCRGKKCKSKTQIGNYSFERNVDERSEEYLNQELIRAQVKELSDQRRAVLEENSYVEILCRKGYYSEEEILIAIEDFWNSRTLLISNDDLQRAVEIKYLMELRRINGIDQE
jgi:hypothetical protein